MKGFALPIVIGLIVASPVVVGARDSEITPAAEIHTTSSVNPSRLDSAEQAWNLIRTARHYLASGDLVQANELLSSAEQTAKQVEDAVTQDQLLSTIAGEYTDQGRYDLAIAIITKMSYNTQSEQYCCIPFRTEAEITVVEAYLKNEQLSLAQQFAERIQFAASRNQVLVAVVGGLADRGRFTEAIALSRRINDQFQAGRARYGIIKGYVNANRFMEGLAFTRNLADPNDRSSFRETLVHWAWRSGQYDTAYQIATRIEAAGTKAQALAEVAIAYHNDGQQSRANAVLGQAYQIARTQRDQQSFSRWAGYFTQIGMFDRAVEIANRLQGSDRGEARLLIAHAYSDVGQCTRALAVAQLVRDGELQPFGDMADPKVATLNQIVKQATRAGQYDIALQAAQALGQGQYRVKALQAIARQYWATNQREKAASTLSQAFEAAKNIKQIVVFYDRNTYFAVSNAGLLIDIVRDYLAINQTDRALSVLAEATQSAQVLQETNMSSVREQVQYLSAIAKIYAQFMQYDRARLAADAAFKLVNEYPSNSQSAYDLLWKVQALSDVAQIYNTAGAGDRLVEVLNSARDLSNAINDNQQKVSALVAIVQAHANLGQEQLIRRTVDSALQLTQTADPFQRNWRTEQLAVAAASADPTYALQLVQTLPDAKQQISALAQIAIKYLSADQEAQAQATVARLRQVAATIPDKNQRDLVLNDVIRSQFVASGPQQRSVLQHRLAEQINADVTAPNLKTYNWSLIAQSYAAQNESSAASAAIASALQTAKSIGDRFERRDILWQMLEDSIGAGHKEVAIQIANGFEEAPYRTTALQRARALRETVLQRY